MQLRRVRKKSDFCVALCSSSLQRTISTPHSSGFTRLEFGFIYKAVNQDKFVKSQNFELLLQHIDVVIRNKV